jgi:hypothetical protein
MASAAREHVLSSSLRRSLRRQNSASDAASSMTSRRAAFRSVPNAARWLRARSRNSSSSVSIWRAVAVHEDPAARSSAARRNRPSAPGLKGVMGTRG